MNIYIGNLPYQITEDEVKELFAEFGAVQAANIIADRETGQSKGFAFVEMPNNDEALKAISGLDGRDVNGRKLRVNEAKPREERAPRQNRSRF